MPSTEIQERGPSKEESFYKSLDSLNYGSKLVVFSIFQEVDLLEPLDILNRLNSKLSSDLQLYKGFYALINMYLLNLEESDLLKSNELGQYQLTENGATIGKAIAGYLMNFMIQSGLEVREIFGASSNKSERTGNKSPSSMFNLFESMVTNPDMMNDAGARVTDLANDLGNGHLYYTSNKILNLASTGLINIKYEHPRDAVALYEPISIEEIAQDREVIRNLPGIDDREYVNPVLNAISILGSKAISRRNILNWIIDNESLPRLNTSNIHFEDNKRKAYARISNIISVLIDSGYMVRIQGKIAYSSVVFNTQEKKKEVDAFVDLYNKLYSVKEGFKERIEKGKSLASEIINNTDSVMNLLELWFARSPNSGEKSSQKTRDRILKILNSNPTSVSTDLILNDSLSTREITYLLNSTKEENTKSKGHMVVIQRLDQMSKVTPPLVEQINKGTQQTWKITEEGKKYLQIKDQQLESLDEEIVEQTRKREVFVPAGKRRTIRKDKDRVTELLKLHNQEIALPTWIREKTLAEDLNVSWITLNKVLKEIKSNYLEQNKNNEDWNSKDLWGPKFDLKTNRMQKFLSPQIVNEATTELSYIANIPYPPSEKIWRTFSSIAIKYGIGYKVGLKILNNLFNADDEEIGEIKTYRSPGNGLPAIFLDEVAAKNLEKKLEKRKELMPPKDYISINQVNAEMGINSKLFNNFIQEYKLNTGKVFEEFLMVTRDTMGEYATKEEAQAIKDYFTKERPLPPPGFVTGNSILDALRKEGYTLSEKRLRALLSEIPFQDVRDPTSEESDYKTGVFRAKNGTMYPHYSSNILNIIKSRITF